jgi:alginate O-acetyltransferase complex protein AlgJ
MSKEIIARRAEEIVLIAFFLSVLSLPLLGTVFHPESTQLWDNRPLAQFPPVTAKFSDVVQFPKRFGSYFKDHFAFRGKLIKAQAVVRVNWLHVSTRPDIIVGKDGWLFYGDANSIASYTRSKPLTQSELERWKKILEARHDWLKQRGIDFIFVIVPNKESVYGEYMRDERVRATGPSRVEQLIDYLGAHSNIRILDLRPALLQSKQRYRLYHQTDSHWNTFGAFTAYRAIGERLRATIPGFHPLSETDFDVVKAEPYSGDLAGMLGLEGIRREDELSLKPRQPLKAIHRKELDAKVPADRSIPRLIYERESSDLPRLVMFGDSFGPPVATFLAEGFGRTTFFENQTVDRAVVESERPRVVIMEMVERLLINDPLDDLPSSGLTRGKAQLPR